LVWDFNSSFVLVLQISKNGFLHMFIWGVDVLHTFLDMLSNEVLMDGCLLYWTWHARNLLLPTDG